MMSLRASMLLATLALFATHDDASAKQEKNRVLEIASADRHPLIHAVNRDKRTLVDGLGRTSARSPNRIFH